MLICKSFYMMLILIYIAYVYKWHEFFCLDHVHYTYLLHCTQDDISGPRKNDEQSLSYAMLYSATTEFQEGSYSPLGEPDLEDLPSFAYQISQGMVNKVCIVVRNYIIIWCTRTEDKTFTNNDA